MIIEQSAIWNFADDNTLYLWKEWLIDVKENLIQKVCYTGLYLLAMFCRPTSFLSWCEEMWDPFTMKGMWIMTHYDYLSLVMLQ